MLLNKDFFKIALVWSFVAALLSIVFIYFLYENLQINPLGGKKEVVVVFLILAMIAANHFYKQKQKVSFKVAFSMCFMVSVFTIILTCVFFGFLLESKFPTMIAEYVASTKALMLQNKTQILNSGIDDEAFSLAIKNLNKTDTRAILTDHVIKQLFLGIVPSLLISLYYHKFSKSN